MIIVSRLNGERFGVNAEHLERVEATPDTVLTLLDGRKYIVQESLEEIIDLVIAYRANVLRISYSDAPSPDRADAPLRLVDATQGEPGGRDDSGGL